MSDIIYSIYDSFRHPKEADQPVVDTGVEPLVLVPGLSTEEQVFVRENRSQLGSGHVKKAVDVTHSWLVLFFSLPIVIQLLMILALIMLIVITPFVIQYTKMAIQSPESSSRTVLSLAVFIIISLLILVVLILL